MRLDLGAQSDPSRAGTTMVWLTQYTSMGVAYTLQLLNTSATRSS